MSGNAFKKITDQVFWWYAIPSIVGYGIILLYEVIAREPSAINILIPSIGIVSSIILTLRGQKRDHLALNDAKRRAREDAVEKIMLIPWLFMADGIKQQTPPSDHERMIKEQRRKKLQTILDESYHDI